MLVAGILVLTPGFAAKIAWLVGLVTLFLAWRFRAGFSKLVFALIAAAFLLGPTIARKLDHPDNFRPLIAAESEFAQMRWTVAIAHRLHIWGYAATQTLEHPILGWGLDASRSIPGGKGPIKPEDLGFIRSDLSMNAAAWLDRGDAVHLSLHTHNATLQIWLELGLAGALFAGGLVIFLVNATVHHRHAAGLALCLSALVIANLSYGIWQSWWLAGLWLIAALYLIGIEQEEAALVPKTSKHTAS